MRCSISERIRSVGYRNRKVEPEVAARADNALDVELLAVRLYQAPGDAESEAGAFVVLGGRLPEALEDVREVCGRNSATSIAHGEADRGLALTTRRRETQIVVDCLSEELHATARGRELDGVAYKIREYLKQATRVGIHWRKPRIIPHDEIDRVIGRNWCKKLTGCGEDFCDVSRLAM